MNIANPPASVLTHGGDSDSAIASTLKTHTETLQAQHDRVMLSGATGVIPERHMHYEDPVIVTPEVGKEYPKILHSTKQPGKTCIVPNSKWEEEALETGEWSLLPMEKVLIETGDGKVISYKLAVVPPTQMKISI